MALVWFSFTLFFSTKNKINFNTNTIAKFKKITKDIQF